MDETYDVLMADGTVVEYAAGQFAETREARSPQERNDLVADGWMALTERIETGTAAKAPSAVEQALTESVVPPAEAPSVTIYVLGRLKPGEQGTKVV
jgi:hypothetical protein